MSAHHPVFRRRSDEIEANGIERLGRSALVLLAPFPDGGQRILDEHRPQAHNITNQTSQRPSVSQLLIHHYLNELQTLRRVSGTTRESVVSEAFKTLLKDWGKSRDLIFIPQYEYQTVQKTRVSVIGRRRTRRTISKRRSRKNFRPICLRCSTRCAT
jgi:hypothetical protein